MGARQEPRLHRVVIDDLRRENIPRSLRRDLKDLYRFYLSEDERTRLASMGPVRRFFRRVWWLLKSILLRLSPARRLLLVLALIVFFVQFSYSPGGFEVGLGSGRLAFLLVLLVLMLELKDKLLARDEIEVARQVQLSLLPSRDPIVDGWEIWASSRPANDVGGDLVDYLWPGGERVGVALGDVAGKGMGAALLTAKLQATLRATAPETDRLDTLGSRLNTILHRDGLDNRYATLFYCEIEPGSGEVRYLNAGHNPPILMRAGASETLAASSFPLGMLPSASYAEGRVVMHPSDVLVVYSDGLTEAQNAEGGELGEGRVRAVIDRNRQLAPQQLGKALLREVERFLGEERLHDDLSLVILRRRES